jgi:DNA modification methylase
MNTNEIIEVRITDIKIGERFRKDMGDLAGLAQSIGDTELLQPIGITPDHELIFGERRLRACRDVMKRETILARIIDVKSVLLGQFAENAFRKEFTPSEMVAIVEAIRSFRHGGDRKSDQQRKCGLEALTTEQAVKKVGWSKDTFRRANHVVENGSPELVSAMDAGMLSINAASELADEPQEVQLEALQRLPNATAGERRGIRKQIGRITRKKAREQLLQQVITEPRQDDAVRILHCPFQQLEQTAGIEPESVDLVLTDIPYGNDFLDQIEELAAFAERLLVPGGLFVAHIGQHRLNEKLRRLDTHLTFQWMAASYWTVRANPVPRLSMVSQWIPVVICSKGEWSFKQKWLDTFHLEVQEKDWHEWQRPLAEIEKLVGYFSQPGDLVVDPCGGGFTTAIACERLHRRCISCEIDKAAVVNGQKRLALERKPVVVMTEPIEINSVTHGDCLDLIPRLPDGSIALVVTSPPYAEQRKDEYPSVPEAEYPEWTVKWMSKLWEKLRDNGSVLMVIDSHVKNGVESDYIERTVAALRSAGWKKHPNRIWLKPDRLPLGHKGWPRHCYEQILWLSKSGKPFCDPKVLGSPATNLFVGDYDHSDPAINGGEGREGLARSTDVLVVPVGGNAKGINHPAKFPQELPEKLISTYCPPGGTVLDPFCGSGTTLLAAQRLGCPFYGFDIMESFCDLSRGRLGEPEIRVLAG